MERKLPKRGPALYKKRGVLVEPVFGQRQGRTGVPTVLLGAARVSGPAGMTHNLLKLWRSGGPRPHGSQGGGRTFLGATSGQWNDGPTSRGTCVSQLAHRSMRFF